jgi:hypothetical protein
LLCLLAHLPLCLPACLPACRAWFDVDIFAAALASEGLSVVDGKAPAPTKVSIKEYDSQSKVSALVNFLKKQKRHQHIRWARPAGPAGRAACPLVGTTA